jgi:hypothetical protein
MLQIEKSDAKHRTSKEKEIQISNMQWVASQGGFLRGEEVREVEKN